MQFSEIITSLLCGVSPFALGWILFSLVVGIRVGWEAGFRLFLLGLGLLASISAIGAILFYLPNWAAVILLLFGALLPWISTLRYFVVSKHSGKLLMALPSNNETLLMSLMSGTIPVLFGFQLIILNNNIFLTPAKSYALGVSMISLGIFRVMQRIRYTQIRETGILYKFGGFYKWENIESYVWKFGEDKLSLKLRQATFKNNVSLKILSQFRQEVVAHLSQNVQVEESNSKGYVPVQKAG